MQAVPMNAVPGNYEVRRAQTRDVPAIRGLIDANVASGRLLDKPTVTLYEDIQEFWVACDAAGQVIGCGALHVMWEDLAEIRTIAVDAAHQGRGADPARDATARHAPAGCPAADRAVEDRCAPTRAARQPPAIADGSRAAGLGSLAGLAAEL